jgi:hypothetical protein
VLGERARLVGVERQQRGEVRAPVAVDDRLRDPAAEPQRVLDVRRRDVLAAGGDDEVLLAARDRQVAVGVELAEVAGVQPAAGAERLARGARAPSLTGTGVSPIGGGPWGWVGAVLGSVSSYRSCR